MSEADIWQIIQTGNEISILRIEVFITITAGVLVISSVPFIRLNLALLAIMLGAYLLYGYSNFSMTVSEMHILQAGMLQLHEMVEAGQEVSHMGVWLAGQAEYPLESYLIPFLYVIYWSVTVSTIAYAIWRYKQQQADGSRT